VSGPNLNTGDVISRVASFREAGDWGWNTGAPVKYGISGNPSQVAKRIRAFWRKINIFYGAHTKHFFTENGKTQTHNFTCVSIVLDCNFCSEKNPRVLKSITDLNRDLNQCDLFFCQKIKWFKSYLFSRFSVCILCCIASYILSYTVSGKKSLQYCMCNFNKFKVILVIFGTYHPETPVY